MCRGSGQTLSGWNVRTGGQRLRCPKCLGRGQILRQDLRSERVRQLRSSGARVSDSDVRRLLDSVPNESDDEASGAGAPAFQQEVNLCLDAEVESRLDDDMAASIQPTAIQSEERESTAPTSYYDHRTGQQRSTGEGKLVGRGRSAGGSPPPTPPVTLLPGGRGDGPRVPRSAITLFVLMATLMLAGVAVAVDEGLRGMVVDWLGGQTVQEPTPGLKPSPLVIVLVETASPTGTPTPDDVATMAVPVGEKPPFATRAPSVAPSWTPSPTAAATVSPTSAQTPFPTWTPEPTSTQMSTPTVTPTTAFTPTPTNTPTATPVPHTPTPEPTATPVPVVSLDFDVEISVVGYRSDGTADVTVHVTLLNEGDLPDETARKVALSCPSETEVLSGCGAVASLTLTDGYGPASDSFILRLPMGTKTLVELDYGGDGPVVADIEAPPRILGVERGLFDCYADREPSDSSDPLLFGCGGWGSPTVEKWLNDTPIKVWATGDPLYIEDFRSVLETLSPLLNLDFVWVDSEQDADLKGYVGVNREDIDHLGFQPHTLDYGGFAGSSKVGGEATSGYFVVWYIDEDPPTAIALHEAVHALLLNSHSTRPLSVVGGSGMALLSPRDEALFRLHYHPLVRPGMTLQEVEDLIVFRDQLLDDPGPEPITDPMQMVWQALVSLDEVGTAAYSLSGGYTDRQCNITFGIRRGPLEFKVGRFRLWKDDPALLYFHDNINEFYIHYSRHDDEWKHHVRPLTGGEWKSLNKNELDDLTNWWIWNGKLHRTLRSILQDASPHDISLDTTAAGSIELHVTIDDSYTHMYLWGPGWRVESVDFTLTLNSETFSIEGYKWVLRDHPPAGDPNYPCLTYEELATDFTLGVEVKLPEDIPE